MQKFTMQIQKFEDFGSTEKLWYQYFEIVTLVKQFIGAKRKENWMLYLETVAKMLPYFYKSVLLLIRYAPYRKIYECERVQ